MEDARHLVRLVEGFTNQRVRRMRSEFRAKVGAAVGIPKRRRDDIDCVESRHVLVILKPDSALERGHFSDHKPLLRQALVAACAATETYIADKAMEVVREKTSLQKASTRLLKLPLTVSDWLHLEENYTYRRRGLHNRVLEPQIREMASTAPNQVGVILSLMGVDSWAKRMDGQRRVPKGDTEAMLKRITERRNKIVHTGDRQGRGRAPLTINEVREDLDGLESVVLAIEAIVSEG